jgi:hypothetical protein
MKLNLILGPFLQLGLRDQDQNITRNQLFLGEVGIDSTGFSGNAHLYCGLKRKSIGWEDRR